MSATHREAELAAAPYGLRLGPPFFAIGLAGGWLTAEVHQLGEAPAEVAIRGLLTVVTPVVAAFLGARMSIEAPPRGPLTSAMTLCVATVLAGVVNGMIVGFFAAPPWGALIGAPWGFICALPFVPVLAAIMAAARNVGRARPESVVDRSDRRAIWTATSVSVALATLVAAPHGSGGVPLLLAFSASCALVGLLSLDLLSLEKLSRPLRLQGTLRTRGPIAEHELDRVPVIDNGLGDVAYEELAPASSAYRSADQVLRIHRGSRQRARAALRSASLRGALALALATAAASAHLTLG
jgi:hypothetical protein